MSTGTTFVRIEHGVISLVNTVAESLTVELNVERVDLQCAHRVQACRWSITCSNGDVHSGIDDLDLAVISRGDDAESVDIREWKPN